MSGKYWNVRFVTTWRIAEEGLCGNYGANIGKVLLATYGDQDVKVRAKAMALPVPMQE